MPNSSRSGVYAAVNDHGKTNDNSDSIETTIRKFNIRDRKRGNNTITRPSLTSTKFSFSMTEDFGDTEPVLNDINLALLKPEEYLEEAIKHMYYLGLQNPTYPPEKVVPRGNNVRQVDREIFEEFFINQANVKIPKHSECTWTEIKRAQLMAGFNEKMWSNIDEFIISGIEDRNVLMALELDSKYRNNCSHLPILWSVFNVRTSNRNEDPCVHKVFLDAKPDESSLLSAMIVLISSRYLVNVVYYNASKNELKTVTQCKTNLTLTKNNPLVIIAIESGDVFLWMGGNSDILSVFDCKEGTIGTNVLEIIQNLCKKRNLLEIPKQVHGLIPPNILEILIPSKYKAAFVMEILLHVLTVIYHNNNDSKAIDFNKDELSSKLISMCNDTLKLQNLKSMYWARVWWAITRGEVGHETEEMKSFFKVRGIPDKLRSSWDFDKRHNLSLQHSRHGSLEKKEILDMLKNFHDKDAITFSSNNTVLKLHVEQGISTNALDKGMYTAVIDPRIDAINAAYSTSDGRRVYTQKELDYMMTQKEHGKNERDRLTRRLGLGASVFFFLHYRTSPEREKINNELGHVALCRVWMEFVSDDKEEYRLVVEWLEGVFWDKYKLCAVPVLTYLANYFGVEIRQIAFEANKMFSISDNRVPDCLPKALYAVNERMRVLYESKGEREWVPHPVSTEKAKMFINELANSLLFIPLGKSICKPQIGALRNQTIKT